MQKAWVCCGIVAAFVFAGCGAGVEQADEGSLEVQSAALETHRSAAHSSVEAAVTEECGQACVVRQWIADERYAEVRDVLAVDLQKTPADVDLTLLMAAAQFGDELYEDAYDLTSELLREVDDVRLLETRAVASLLAHDVETAAHDFGETIEALQSFSQETRQRICNVVSGRCASPLQREAYAWLGLATAEFNRRNLNRALEIVTDLEETPLFDGLYDPAAVSFIKGLIASRTGDDESAEAFYMAVLEAHPNDPGTLVNLGGIAYRNGDLVRSRQLQTQAFENANRNRRIAAIAWSNVAEVDMLEGDYDGALAKVLEALQISRGFAGGFFQLGVIHDVMGNTHASAVAIKHALALDIQGVSRWNISMYNAEWETHFAALVAEGSGDMQAAQEHWSKLRDSRNVVLAGRARLHLDSVNQVRRTAAGK
jgi:tetratricopeptide (TPR) repeat protein